MTNTYLALKFTSCCWRTMILSVLLLACWSSQGQDAAQGNDQDDYKRRYAFAKSFFGADLIYAPGGYTANYLTSTEELASFSGPGMFTPAINMGASHFWGHADFYVSITTSAIAPEDPIKVSTRLGALTGVRFYPWALQDSGWRPHLGYKFSPIRNRRFSTMGNYSFQHTRVRGVLEAGLGGTIKEWYLTLSYAHLLNRDLPDFPLSRTARSDEQFNPGWFTLGINRRIETTYNGDRKGNRYLSSKFRAGGNYGWFLGTGPSTAFPTRVGSLFAPEQELSFLDGFEMADIFFDLAGGYHFLPFDATLSLSYRPIVQTRTAGGYEMEIRRRSLLLEAYKYLGDYHGFCPFIGGGISREWLRRQDTDLQVGRSAEYTAQRWSPVITIGWDIRPNRFGDAWLLRTNLRYTPTLDWEFPDGKVDLRHLEFNFIQLIVFPGRLGEMIRYY